MQQNCGHVLRAFSGACARIGSKARRTLRSVASFICLTVCVVLGTAVPAAAQDVAACGEQPAVYAVSAGSDTNSGQASPGLPVVFINDYVEIGVCHLDAFVASAQARQQDVTLHINGLDFGLKPVDIDFDRSKLRFTLDITPQNKPLWKPLLYNPFVARHELLRVGVGTPNSPPLPKLSKARTEIRFNKLWVDAWTIGFVVLLVTIAAVTVYWARNSDMLRDAPSMGGVRQTYSLGRVQMAWWFNLIVFGYVAIWLITGEQDSLSGSLVALMGISAATGLSATVITPSATRRAAALKARLAEQRDALDQAIGELAEQIETIKHQTSVTMPPSADSALALLEGRMAERQHERAQLALSMCGASPLISSRGFWHDLVTDDRGVVALDRLQIVVWTAVLSGLFLYSVLFYLSMPEFSEAMLLLMGISSGTYIGFKFPETRN